MNEGIKTIDVEEIMQSIRKEIKEKGYKTSDLKFADIKVFGIDSIEGAETCFDINRMRFELEQVASLQSLQIVYPITGNKIKVFAKKLIRKMIAFHVNKIANEQNAYNYHNSVCIAQMYKYAEETQKRMDELEAKIAYLEKKFDA